jgi:hypothetical protein
LWFSFLKKRIQLFFLQFDLDPIFLEIFISDRLDSGDLGVLPLGFEKVAEAFLGL